MKNLTHFLFVYLLLINMSSIMTLDLGSFHPIETIEMKGTGTYSASFGYSISAGDIDRDGYDDIIIGAPKINSGAGEVFVIYGGPATSLSNINLDTLPLNPPTTGFTVTPRSGSKSFGISVSTADINKDGYGDIIIGVDGETSSQGAAYVIYGGPRSSRSNIDLSVTTLNPLTTGFRILAANSRVMSVSSAGDIDKDGYDDILIGNTGPNSPEAVFIVYGGEKADMRDIDLSATPLNPSTTGFMITGDGADEEFGNAVSNAGDINKDGYSDIIIGASAKTNKKGAAYIIYGGPRSSMSNIDLSTATLNPLTTGFMITGAAEGDVFAVSVDSAGDFNNDGYADIVIGAPGNLPTSIPATYIVYGGPKSSMSNIDLSTPLNPKTNGLMITGTLDDKLGLSAGNAGDMNKDGYDDVVIGAPFHDNLRGATYVIYGGAKSSRSNIDLSSVVLDPLTTGFSIFGTMNSGVFGWGVSAGDINKDGHSDLIFSALNAVSLYLILGQCPKYCQTCSSASTCDVCLQGYDLRNSLCYPPCPNNCDTCSTSTSCNACTSPFLLYSGKCLATCPSRTFTPDMKECQNCPVGCSQCTSSSTCQICSDGYLLTESQACQKIGQAITEVEEKDIEKTAAGVFEGTSLVAAALGSGTSLPLNFGLATKFLRNIKYMKIPVSLELQEAFISWKMPSKWISAPKSWTLTP